MSHVTGSFKKPYFFTTKNSSLGGFKTISTSEFNSINYGDIITGSAYPLISSISSDLFPAHHNSLRIRALKNTLNYNIKLSKHYSFESEYGNKSIQELKLISIPSLYYGSSIKKGSISCKWYLTGTLIAELQDIKQNGELIQVGPSGSNGSGSVAGVVLYNEGFLLLTGSWNLHPTYQDNFKLDTPSSTYFANWKYYMSSGALNPNHTENNETICGVPSSSFSFDFEGINYIETITMMARAEKGELNHSNNKTYIKYGQQYKVPLTSSTEYIERNDLEIKNIVLSDFKDEDPKFEKITYISKIGIYDEQKNLIGIVKLATPVRKKVSDSYLFKIKMDI